MLEPVHGGVEVWTAGACAMMMSDSAQVSAHFLPRFCFLWQTDDTISKTMTKELGEIEGVAAAKGSQFGVHAAWILGCCVVSKKFRRMQ